MNIQQMMKQAQEMQERLQRELAEMVVEATAGGGMVTVRMNGHKQIIGLTIDPEVVDPEDTEMLQDLVLSAVNDAGRRVDESAAERMGGLAGGLPGLL